MTRIIAIANHKGGVGKTTSVACIGQALSRYGLRTLLVDLDAQANLSGIFLKEEAAATLFDYLSGRAEALPIIAISERLHLLPSSLQLARAEVDLAGRIARERIIADLLEPIAGQYDYILIDCPPSLGLLTMNALVAASELYVPLTAEALPLKGLAMLEDIAAQLRRAYNSGLEISGIIVTRYNNRKLNKAVLSSIKQRYGAKVFSTMIRENITIAEAPLYGGDLFSYAPNSYGAQDYKRLTEEIINRLNK